MRSRPIIERPATDVHGGGNSGPEAPPWSPGHVGHTPQRIVSALIRHRLAGIFSSATALTPPREFAMQPFQRPQRFERAGQISTLLSLEDFRRRQHAGQPWPQEFRAAVTGPLSGSR